MQVVNKTDSLKKPNTENNDIYVLLCVLVYGGIGLLAVIGGYHASGFMGSIVTVFIYMLTLPLLAWIITPLVVFTSFAIHLLGIGIKNLKKQTP